jgi:hypothetical protein
MRSVDIQKANFIGARRIIGPRRINRITRIAQADKVHAFDHAPISHV